jgi:hypothetical protein
LFRKGGDFAFGLPRARNIVGKESGNAPRNAAFLSHSMRSFAGVMDWESTWAPACAVADGGRGGSQNLSTCGRLLFVAREKNSVGRIPWKFLPTPLSVGVLLAEYRGTMLRGTCSTWCGRLGYRLGLAGFR